MNGDEFHADRGLGFGVMEFSPNPNPNPPPIRESAFTRPLPSLSSPPSRVLMPRNGVAQNGPPKDPDPAAVPVPAQAPVPAGDEGIRYRECLRNHAAALGGHVLDGCGEFMPGAPEAMKCAACGCHRSFHRRESDGDPTPSPFYRRIPLLLPPPPSIRHHHKLSGFPPSPVAASGGTTTESSSEERIAAVDTAAAIAIAPPPKKRFRTKFTVEQKERMMGFANAVGWRMQKQDEGEMGRFCSEIGISRQVLKVWMHNNKHTVRRPQVSEQDQHQQQIQQQLEP